jgi:hypothetical protein
VVEPIFVKQRTTPDSSNVIKRAIILLVGMAFVNVIDSL